MITLEEQIKKLESFKTFKNNWNGYGAKPFSEKLINKALNMLKELNPLPYVFPTGRDSIQFEWETDNEELYLEMEIFEDKIHIFNMYDNKKNKVITIGDD